MSKTSTRTESSILLENISWKTYERLLEEVGERHIRLTYDNGDLEIMTLSHGHERRKTVIGRLIEFLSYELLFAIRSGGSNTMRKKLKKKGLEPDECYWVANEKAMRGKDEFEPNVDPPPDLAVEVDVTSSSMDRMAIYAALKIPEVWRYHRRHLRVYRLTGKGAYEESRESQAFPFLAVSELDTFIHQADKEDETTVLRSFVRWVRAEVAPAYEAYLARRKSSGNGARKNKR